MNVLVGRHVNEEKGSLSLCILVLFTQSAAVARCPSALLHSLLSQQKISMSYTTTLCVVRTLYVCACTSLTDKSSS